MKGSVKNFLRFVAGFVTAVLLMIIIPLLVLATGLVDFSARSDPSKIESVLAPWALDRSLDRHAPTAKNPFAKNASVLAAGLAHYRENCLVCHGVPEVPPGELAAGLNPPPPSLLSDDVQSLPDSRMFWIVQNGIRMTGMPAFGPTHSDEEIWKIVTFVKHLPELTDAETSALKTAAIGEAHHQE
jgi:mono/diheme cytochrome c family protein